MGGDDNDDELLDVDGDDTSGQSSMNRSSDVSLNDSGKKEVTSSSSSGFSSFESHNVNGDEDEEEEEIDDVEEEEEEEVDDDEDANLNVVTDDKEVEQAQNGGNEEKNRWLAESLEKTVHTKKQLSFCRTPVEKSDD